MPTQPFAPESVLPNVPTRPIEGAIELAVRNAVAGEHLEAIGNLQRAGLIRADFMQAAFAHWGIRALWTTVYPLDLMRHLYDNWYDLNLTRGTFHSLDLFAAAVETAYQLVFTENAGGRRVSMLVNVYPFARGAPSADQQVYLLGAYRWLVGNQIAVSAIRIIQRSELPVILTAPARAVSVSYSV